MLSKGTFLVIFDVFLLDIDTISIELGLHIRWNGNEFIMYQCIKRTKNDLS